MVRAHFSPWFKELSSAHSWKSWRFITSDNHSLDGLILSPIKVRFHSILTNNFSPRSLDLWLLSASPPNTQESGQKGEKQQRGIVFLTFMYMHWSGIFRATLFTFSFLCQ
jgi:hypothetical protein